MWKSRSQGSVNMMRIRSCEGAWDATSWISRKDITPPFHPPMSRTLSFHSKHSMENRGVKACYGSIWHATMSLMWLRSYPFPGSMGEGSVVREDWKVRNIKCTVALWLLVSKSFGKKRFVAFATTRCCSMCVASLHPQRRGARRRPSWVSSRSTFNGNFKLRHLATAAVPGFRDVTWRDSYAEPFWEGVNVCTRLCSRPWHLYNSILCILF